MVIVVAGIKRSGSTAQYNLIRLALTMAGYEVTIYGHNYQGRIPKKNEAHLIKRHPYSKDIANIADYIFLTDRNDEDILKSLDRMWGSGDPERIEGMRKDLKAWMAHEHYLFKYEEFAGDNAKWAYDVIDILGVDVDPQRLMKEFNKIEPPKDEYDPVTCLFPGHISQ